LPTSQVKSGAKPSGFGRTDCEAYLESGFVATSYDKNGKQIKTVDKRTGTQLLGVGLFCGKTQQARHAARSAELFLLGFHLNGLRGGNVAVTYLCSETTGTPDCTPNSPYLIGGFEFGSLSQSKASSKTNGGSTSGFVTKLNVSGFDYDDLGDCNKVEMISPIVIERTYGKGVTTLDPNATQTYFDLKGEGQENRISCVSDGAFLALPDFRGNIVNINQLFGDNTIGPDGYKSANGFLSLGKHDTKLGKSGYGTLTTRDPVFSRLRLWEDLNCDGTAQKSEVHGLSDWKITEIRWIDAVEMMEVDAFGNETRQRNMMGLEGNKKLRAFDLWFKAQD
jgi:hypothetical protein